MDRVSPVFRSSPQRRKLKIRAALCLLLVGAAIASDVTGPGKSVPPSRDVWSEGERRQGFRYQLIGNPSDVVTATQAGFVLEGAVPISTSRSSG